jgi:hypothetical protein
VLESYRVLDKTRRSSFSSDLLLLISPLLSPQHVGTSLVFHHSSEGCEQYGSYLGMLPNFDFINVHEALQYLKYFDGHFTILICTSKGQEKNKSANNFDNR